MKVAIYARVSTKDQNINKQIKILQEYCERNKYSVYYTYKDDAVSGSETSRQGLNDLFTDGYNEEYDMILVYDIDRIGRSWELGVTFENFLKDTGIELESLRDDVDMKTANGRLNYRIKCVVAAFEREATREKSLEGIKLAKKQGKYKGRKPGSKNKPKRGRPRKKK